MGCTTAEVKGLRIAAGQERRVNQNANRCLGNSLKKKNGEKTEADAPTALSDCFRGKGERGFIPKKKRETLLKVPSLQEKKRHRLFQAKSRAISGKRHGKGGGRHGNGRQVRGEKNRNFAPQQNKKGKAKKKG